VSVTRSALAGKTCQRRLAAWLSPQALNMAPSKQSLRSADSLVRAERPQPGDGQTCLSALRQFPSWEGLGVDSWRPGANICLAGFSSRSSFGQNHARCSAKYRRGDGSPSDSKCSFPTFSR
jgi:hypothetical protein